MSNEAFKCNQHCMSITTIRYRPLIGQVTVASPFFGGRSATLEDSASVLSFPCTMSTALLRLRLGCEERSKRDVAGMILIR